MTRRQFLAAVTAAVVVPWRTRPVATGISIRVVRDYDVRTDQWVARHDVLYGMAVLRPELAARVLA